MEEKKDNSEKDETSSKATVERGKEAIKADEKINKKDPHDPTVKKEQKEDAEKWRNEG